MKITPDIVDKFDKQVRQMYPTCIMSKIGENILIWTNDYARVATLNIVEGTPKLTMERPRKT